MLFERCHTKNRKRSIKQHIKHFNVLNKIQLDHHVPGVFVPFYIDSPLSLSFQFLRSSTNLFLLNLSVADLLVLVTSCPTSLMEIAMRTDAWIFGEVRKY